MSWRQRFRNLWHTDSLERDIDRELAFHQQESVDDLMAAGLPEHEARREARLRLGNPAVHRESTREMDVILWLEETTRDLKVGLRRLRKEPGFALLAVLSLGLAIGANAAVYGLLGKLMYYQLPADHPEQLYTWGEAIGGGVVIGLGPGPIQVFPPSLFHQAEAPNPFFESVAATNSFRTRSSVRVSPQSGPEEILTQLVSGSYFPTLGLKPRLGRLIEPADDHPGSTTAVLSADCWRQRFGSDPSVIGRTIRMNKTMLTIAGVAPDGFHGLRVDSSPVELYVPLSLQPETTLGASLLSPSPFHWLTVFGRLKPGANPQAAQSWVESALRRTMLQQEGTVTPERAQEIQRSTVPLTPLSAGISGFRKQYAQPLRILWTVVALVLLIACANLASYTLARQAARSRELAARLALGSGSARLFRQLLSEGLLLGLAGGAVGLVFAQYAGAAMLRFAITSDNEAPIDASLDARQLWLTLALGLAAGLLVSLLPAWQAARLNLSQTLRASSRGTSGRLPWSRLLVIAQVALSLVLLVGAGLFLRTVQKLGAQSLGFERKSLLLVEFNAKLAGIEQPALRPLYERLLRQVSTLPGVRSVSLSNTQPIGRGNWSMPVYHAGRTGPRDENVGSLMMRVSGDYFSTTGVAILRGRPLNNADRSNTTRVAVINETLARQLFHSSDPIGQFAQLGPDSLAGPWQIVGIAANGKYNGLREEPQAMMFLPLDQMPGEDLFVGMMQIRVEGDPAAVTSSLRSAFAQASPELVPKRPRPIADVVDRFMTEEQLVARLCTFFGALALLLAAIGLYGVMSHTVVRRQSEIGLRMALGAAPSSVRRMILGESALLLAAGLTAGAPLALGAAQLVRAQLYGVTSYDSLTLAGAIAGTVLVVLLAAWWPARRATLVDPMTALRED